MTPEQFTYWLQGYSEVCGDTPTDEQWGIIQDHLQLVFQKETPDRKYDFFGVDFAEQDFEIPESPSCGDDWSSRERNICDSFSSDPKGTEGTLYCCGYQEQIDSAKRIINGWPAWMKQSRRSKGDI